MYSDSEDSEDDERSSSSASEECNVLDMIKENDPDMTMFDWIPQNENDVTDEAWEELGHAISNNTHLKSLELCGGALDDNTIPFLFRGLTRSASIKYMDLYDNGLSVAGVQSMVPFLQNANNLTRLDLAGNNIRSGGFNLLLRALSNSPIEMLNCCRCGVEFIDVDSEHIPKYLATLYLDGNNINTDGCRGLAKLLQGGDATLTNIHLYDNKIDDEGVAILVDALQNNKSLKMLDLTGNDGISDQGQILLLKLVNDISSIKATLQSNRKLAYIYCDEIQRHIDMATENIDMATMINSKHESNPEAAGREKMIQTQLNSGRRSELADLQGVNHSLYSEINPLHLPEVLSLVDQHHGQGELYVALRSSIAGVISTVNRKECLQQQRASLRAKLEAVEAEISAIEAAEGYM